MYGTKVIPENIGNYEPEAFNNHPARLPADLVAAAKDNLAVRDGFAQLLLPPVLPAPAVEGHDRRHQGAWATPSSAGRLL
ncbi:hypothetical protein ACRAWF_42110 [Streptomyces sp. L7]